MMADAVAPSAATAATTAAATARGPAPVRGVAPAAAARDFEAVFAGEMTKIMMDTVDTSGPFGGGHGEEVFRGVLAEQLGGAIARHGRGIGIAPAVLDQIIRLQGGASSDGK